MSIKVLVISDYSNYHITRPEASIFVGLAKQGIQVHIMTSKESRHVDEFESVGIEVIDFHPQKRFNKSEISRIRETIVDKGIDILYLFNNTAIVNGIRAAKGFPVKIVLYRGYAGNIHWYDPTAYNKFLHPRVDKIVCNSKGVEEYIHRQLFVDKSITITINKGHNIEWYKAYQPHDIRKELGLLPDTFLIINVANNRKMKGIPYLLKAFNRIPSDHPIHLLLVGMNMENRQNARIVNQGPKKDKVHFMGFREDNLNIVAGCDAFILPSVTGESITKSVMEAMSLGIPSIITEIPGNKELIIDDESGLIVPAKNTKELSEAILRLYMNPSLCKVLGENAKRRIKNHLNSSQTIIQTKELFEELVSQ